MGVFIEDSGEFIKFLREKSGGDVDYIKYYNKSDLSQEVVNDTWNLIADGDIAESVGSPGEFKNFEGGVYNSWDEVTDYIQNIIIVTSPSNIRTNFILVKSLSDFPSASGGVITLDTNTCYEINGAITLTTEQIDVNGSCLVGYDVFEDQIIKTGSGSLFTGSKGGIIKQLLLTASAGSLFGLNDSGQTEQIVVRSCIIANCASVGTISGYDTVFFDTINYSANTDGITYTDNLHLLRNDIAWYANNDGTFETLSGTFTIVELIGGFYHPTAALAATALDVSGIVAISEGMLEHIAFTGDGTFVTGTFSKEWEVESSGIDTEKDDVSAGEMYISSSAATTIAVVDTPVKLAGTTTAGELFRFDMPTDNRLRYIGTKTVVKDVTASVSFTTASNNQDISFYIYFYDDSAASGSVLTKTRVKRRVGTGADVGALAVTGSVEMDTNDYIEIHVENNTGGTNATGNHMNVIIK